MNRDEPTLLTISPQEARVLQADPLTTFIDVRDAEEYEARHIVGAIHVSLDQIESSAELLSKDRPVVVYCNMNRDDASRSAQAARQLHAAGYDARALQGGLRAWTEAGFSVAETG